MMQKDTSRAGFSLIELMVVVVLGTLIMVSVMNLFFAMLRGGGEADRIAKLREHGDPALVTIERVLRQAKSIDISGGAQYDCDSAATHRIRVVRETETGVDEQVDLYMSSDRIYKTVNAGTPVPITGDVVWVSSLTFDCQIGTGFDPSVVEVGFELRDGPAGAFGARETFNTTVTMRNTGI